MDSCSDGYKRVAIMKNILLVLMLLQVPASNALTETQYREEFRKNFYQSCYRGMTSGADKVDRATANKMCSCQANDIVSRLSVPELQKFDKNPLGSEDIIAKVISSCFLK
jgi:hypothetical protein